MPVIVPVTTRTRLKQFVELPYRQYASDPRWVPPLRRDEYRRLSAKNPFLEHGRITMWLAMHGDEVAGRIAAIEDRLHDEVHGIRVTWFGFFESRDARTSTRLLDTVEAHARARGSEAVYGPANPSLNESAGLLVDGFETDPYLLMPHNPPRYASDLEAAGYFKLKDLFAWHIDLNVPLPSRLQRIAERVARRGVTLRPLDLAAFDRDLAIVQRIYESAWRGNWGFVPPTEAETRQLAHDLKPIIDPELVVFAEVQGRAVACVVGVPDANQLLKKMGGRLLPLGFVHALRKRTIITQARLILLGVVPEFQRTGLYPLLIADLHRRGRSRGYQAAELSWTLEDNDAINRGIEEAGGRKYKTYRLYRKELGSTA